MSYYVNPHNHQCSWHPYAELFGAPSVNWCEETMCHWISQPANAYSAAAYLIAAIYIFWRATRSRQSELLWFSPAMFLLGLFTFAYHLANNYLGQVLAFVGMFLFICWAVALNASRLEWIGKRLLFLLLGAQVALLTGALHILYVFHLPLSITLALAALAMGITERLAGAKSEDPLSYKFYWAGTGFLTLGALASLADLSKTFCDPSNHWFQSHALSHLLVVAGLTMIYHHYEQFHFSERPHIDYDVDEIETQLEV